MGRINSTPNSLSQPCRNAIKGKGLSFAENNNKFHHAVLTESLYNKALEEIKNYNEI